MLRKTKAVVLKSLKYSESSIICHCYTEQFGRLSFMVSGVSGKRSKFKLNFFQSLNFIEIDIYYKEKQDLHRLKDIKIIRNAYSFQVDFVKNAVSLFLSELLYKTLKEHTGNEPLFNFLFYSLSIFDEMEDGKANFHLLFLLELSKYYGFYPQKTDANQVGYFNYGTGSFSSSSHSHTATREISLYINQFLESNFEQLQTIKLNKELRSKVLETILNLYKYHLEGIQELESVAVLKELFK